MKCLLQGAKGKFDLVTLRSCVRYCTDIVLFRCFSDITDK